MKISKEEVQKMADLARLKLGDGDLDHYVEELSAILGYVEKLNELNTKNVELTGNISLPHSTCRKDEKYEDSAAQRTGSAKNIMGSAPFTKDKFVSVKSVFGKINKQ
jgi:aspartyl-tRNA(Asn)/glutamyl-tRNA(Gln) amidotransferase subunit C